MPTNTTAYLTMVSSPGAFNVPANSSPPRVGQSYRLVVAGKNLLGRSLRSTIVLPWNHVSRQQAVIEFFLPGSWEIEDLQSRNGTFVNGRKLSTQTLTPLNDGDRICIGSLPRPDAIEFLFTFEPLPTVTAEDEYERNLEADEFRNESNTGNGYE